MRRASGEAVEVLEVNRIDADHGRVSGNGAATAYLARGSARGSGQA